MWGTSWLSLIIVFFVVVLIFKSMVKISPSQRGVKETLSKYVETLSSGWHFLIPFISSVRLVDIREKVLNTGSHEMITKDNAVVTVDAVAYMQIATAYKAVYEIDDPRNAVVQLVLANLRSMIWKLSLDECLAERWKINQYVQTHLTEETSKWGIKILRVEIQRIDPPADLTRAMQEQKKAEQEKRAAILRAEWTKEAAIRAAEWERQKNILEAQWKAQALERIAEAKAKALEVESLAAIEYFKWPAVLKEQLKVTENAMSQNTKYIVDTDILGTLKWLFSSKK